MGGAHAACKVARARRGTWFDPALADALCTFEHDDLFWNGLEHPKVSAWEPTDRVATADHHRLDRVAEAFAAVVDAKSPYTAAHSAGVARIAVGLGRLLGVGQGTERDLYRAGLLHDIGKLALSNRILDKPGALDADEWRAVRKHPMTSLQILRRVAALRSVARMAGLHHERLDGSGYYLGFDGTQLDRASRVLAVADVAEALSAERPYRAALGPEEVLGIMLPEAGTTLDAEALEALQALLIEPELLELAA